MMDNDFKFPLFKLLVLIIDFIMRWTMSKIKLKFMQYSAVKTVGLTVLYFIILIALYLIYGSGDTHNNFIYNEF